MQAEILSVFFEMLYFSVTFKLLIAEIMVLPSALWDVSVKSWESMCLLGSFPERSWMQMSTRRPRKKL